MALLDKITVHPRDLVNVLESVQQTGYTGHIKLIDTNGSITVRDSSDLFLTEVKKHEEPADVDS